MFSNKESNTYLSQILDKQNDILTELRDINNNIVKYFGKEYDSKERELTQNIKNAHFTNKQFDVLKEVIEYVKEKHSKENKKECEHDWVFVKQTTNTGGTDIHYRCRKCNAYMVKNGDVVYQSSNEWQT